MVFYCPKHRRLGETDKGKCPFCKEDVYKAKLCKECLLEKNIADIDSDGICSKCKEDKK